MIPNITRGGNMADLLGYLYGPGKANEHERPHMVAASQHEATLHKPLGETLTQVRREATHRVFGGATVAAREGREALAEYKR